MNILITGGAGFIGSQLGFYLKDKGHDVRLLDNLKYGYADNLIKDGLAFPHFVCVDIRDSKIESMMKNVDVVFHFAGISSLPECQSNPGEAYMVNVGGTANILEMARRNAVKKVIFSSTCAIYENETDFPSDESAQVKPTLVYSLSKKNAEEICQSFRDAYGMNIIILRFFNVYGPHMDYLRPNPPLVSYIVKCLLKDEAPILHSDGKQARDMIYISDVLDMCELVMTRPEANNEVFNVGSGITTTVQEVYDAVAKAFGKEDIKPHYREAKLLWDKYSNLFSQQYPFHPRLLEKEVNKYTLSSTKKGKDILNWEARVSIEEGMKMTVEYARDLEKRKNLKL